MATGKLATALLAAACALEAAAPELNRLDGFAGDGDLGITMTEVARVVRELVAGADATRPAQLLSSLGAAIARHAPSTSGTLVATGFLRASRAVDGLGVVPGAEATSGTEALAVAFGAALEGVQARGKAAVGDRTLVDGLDAACRALHERAGMGLGWQLSLQAAADAAQAAAEATTTMEPKRGRASWVPQRALGHPDAGCTMLAMALQAAARSAAAPGVADPDV